MCVCVQTIACMCYDQRVSSLNFVHGYGGASNRTRTDGNEGGYQLIAFSCKRAGAHWIWHSQSERMYPLCGLAQHIVQGAHTPSAVAVVQYASPRYMSN